MDPEEGMNHLTAIFAEIQSSEKEKLPSSQSQGQQGEDLELFFQSAKFKVQDFFSGHGEPVEREVLGVKVVMISDTHGDHRSLTLPDGDILIHAGDWTCYGQREHAEDFNDWLGTLPHTHKIVVNGNHESNSMWKRDTPAILSNATFLCQTSTCVSIRGKEVKIFGTNFFWPTAYSPHPFLSQIPSDVDILVTHGPPFELADKGKGCEYLQKKCLALAYGGVKGLTIEEERPSVGGKLRLVVCGHIHYAYGVDDSLPGITVVNAASCGNERKVSHEPIVLHL